MTRIYLIEDDPKIAGLLKEYLEKYDFDLQITTDFNSIMSEFELYRPHLVLLDINLPRYDGFYWCRQIRTVSNCPIIFISARESGMDQVMAIENGGDDYITKPFSFEVVLAKVKGILRRVYGKYSIQSQSHFLDVDGLQLSIDAMELSYQGQRTALTKKEFVLTKELLEHINQVIAREDLLELLWDDQTFVDDNTLSVNVTRLRKKLEDLGIHNALQTIRGAGYKLVQSWSESR